jgi:hypothetical protein
MNGLFLATAVLMLTYLAFYAWKTATGHDRETLLF